MEPSLNISVGILFRSTLLLLVAELSVALYMTNAWTANLSFFTVVVITLFMLLYLMVFMANQIRLSVFRQVSVLLDWLWIAGGGVLAAYLLLLVFTGRFASGPIYEYIRTNDYWVFPGFTVREFALVAVSGFLILLLLTLAKRFQITVFSQIEPFIDYAVVFGILYAVSTIFFHRADDNTDLARFNMSAIVGPVSDLLAGKTLLVNSWAQYGVLDMYTLSFLMSFLPRTYTSFVWIIFSFTSILFIFLYFAMKRWFGWFAVFGVLLIFEHYHFATSNNIILNTQQSLVRFGLWIPIFFYLCLKEINGYRLKNSKLFELFMVGIAFLWAFDVGVYAVGAYTVYRIYKKLLNTDTILHKLKNCLIVILEIAGTLVLSLGIFSVFTFIRSGIFPDWLQYLLAARYFTSGLSVFPMPKIGPYMFVLLFYAAIMVYLLYCLSSGSDTLTSRQKHDLYIIVFLEALGLLQFMYYTGQSSSNGNLHAVSIPLLILLSYFLTKFPELWKKTLQENRQAGQRLLLFFGITDLFLVFTIVMTIGTLNMLTGFTYRADIFYPWMDDSPKEQELAPSVLALTKYLDSQPSGQRRPALLSLETHYFLFKTHSANLLDYNNAYLLYTVPQIAAIGRQIEVLMPDVLFADHGYSYTVEMMMNHIRGKYEKVEEYGYLDKWVKRR